MSYHGNRDSHKCSYTILQGVCSSCTECEDMCAYKDWRGSLQHKVLKLTKQDLQTTRPLNPNTDDELFKAD